MSVIATAKSGQSFTANTLHNIVVEPMVEESNVKVVEDTTVALRGRKVEGSSSRRPKKDGGYFR